MKYLTLAAGALLLCACAREPALADIERDGISALRSGDLTAAGRGVDEGLRLAAGRGDASWQQRFRLLRAEVLVEQRRGTDALALLGGDVSPAGAADPLTVRFLIARGRAYCLTGDAGGFDRGERDLDAAAGIAARLPPSEMTAGIPLYRGSCAFDHHDNARADQEFRRALTLARQQHAALLEAKAEGSIGMTATRRFRFDEAQTWFERVLAGTTTDLVRVKTLNNLGWCNYTLGDFERALTYLADADRLAEARGYASERQRALQMAGNAHYRLGDHAGAAEAFRRSLALAREVGDQTSAAELLSNLAIVALDQKQLDRAHELVGEALAIKRARGDAGAIQHSLLTEGQIRAAAGDTSAAEGYYQGVLASATEEDHDLKWEAQAALAQLRINTGRPDDADAEFRRAFDLIELSAAEVLRTEHRLSFYSSVEEFQDAYVDFLVSRGDTRRALEVADRSRARLLREQLLAGAAPAAGAVQFQQAAAALKATILFYWLAPSRSFVWAVSRGGIAFAFLPGADAIAAHVDAYQRVVLRSRDPIAEGTADARWLYDALIQPVQAAVPPRSRVVFVPDGALHEINPETLVVSAPAPHYWIEDVTLSIAPSISVLAAPSSAPAAAAAASRAILIIGDPVPAPPDYPRLTHASQEIARISDRFSPDTRTVFTGAQAEPRAYLASDPGHYAFIHFAAHGIANREAPLESAVVLSATDDQSKLYARDILRVPIRADLVTISACRGAGSRTYAGEGLVGLTWAFLTSGARNVIAALWNVDDASTAALMDGLYERLARGAAPADALRESKLSLLGSTSAYRKPFYWAPFLTYTRSLPAAARMLPHRLAAVPAPRR